MHDAAALNVPQVHDRHIGIEIQIPAAAATEDDDNNNNNRHNHNDLIGNHIDINHNHNNNNNNSIVASANDLGNCRPDELQIKGLEPLIAVASLSGVEWRDYVYECPAKGCGLAFASDSLLQEHMLAAHDQMMPPEYQGLVGPGPPGHQGIDEPANHDGLYPCPLCDSTFDSKDLLEEHIDSHQQERGILECDFCGIEFLSRLELTKHMALHGQESQGDPQCQLCGKFFATREEAILHLKVHSTPGSPGGRIMKQRKFKCERCDRSFFTRKDVKRHMVVHTGQRNFVCQYCPQKFGRKDHLVRHTKKTHTNGSSGGGGGGGGSSNNNNNNNNNNPNATNNNTMSVSLAVVSSNQGTLQSPIVGNGGSGHTLVPSPPVPLSDPGVSSTTGLLPPEPAPPQSPLLGPSMSGQQSMMQSSGHGHPHSSAPPGTPGTPVIVKTDGNGQHQHQQQLAFSYSELTPAQVSAAPAAQYHLEDVVAVNPQSPACSLLAPLAASTSTIGNTHHQLVLNSTPSVTVLPAGAGLGGLNAAGGLNVNLNVSVLQSGKDPLVSHPSWPPTSSAAPTAYLSPSFSSYFVDDENRNAVPLTLKGGDQLPSMATLTSLPSSSTNAITTNAGLPSMTSDFHPSSTSSSYFTLMPIISQNPPVGIGVGGYYSVGTGGQGAAQDIVGVGVGGLSPLSPTSPQTTTPLTPPLADGLRSPLPHFSQAFQ